MLLGCDPEVVMTIERNDYAGLLPAKFVLRQVAKLSPGMVNSQVKDSPAISNSFGVIFADGASWELNPKPGNPQELTNNLRGLMSTTKTVIALCSSDRARLHLHTSPAIDLDLDMLDVWSDPMLTVFGCDPDKSIYKNREINPSCIDAANHPARYFGGHIHFGWSGDMSPEDFYQGENLYHFISLCDATIGMCGILLDAAVESDAARRRRVYGQPGVYRAQPHGIEYRTLSNSWLKGSERALSVLNVARWLPELFDSIDVQPLEELIRYALVTGDQASSREVLTLVVDMFNHQTFSDDVARVTEVANLPTSSWMSDWGL